MKHKVYTSKQLTDAELNMMRSKFLVATYKKGDRTYHLVVGNVSN